MKINNIADFVKGLFAGFLERETAPVQATLEPKPVEELVINVSDPKLLVLTNVENALKWWYLPVGIHSLKLIEEPGFNPMKGSGVPNEGSYSRYWYVVDGISFVDRNWVDAMQLKECVVEGGIKTVAITVLKLPTL